MAYRHHVRAQRTEAPIAPPVDDPRVCRWCREKRLDGNEPCVNGCLSNDHEPIYVKDCQDCGSEFQTGQLPINAILCFACDEADKARQDAYHKAEGPRVRGFLSSEIRRGMDRRLTEGK